MSRDLEGEKAKGLGEKIVDHWLGIILAAGSFAFALALFQGWAEIHLAGQETAAVEILETGDPAEGEPAVRIWIDRTPLHLGETVTLRLRFRNLTPQALSIRLEELHHTPLLSPRSSSWAKVTGAWGGRKLPWRQAAFDLAPGAETTVWTELLAGKSAGSVILTPVVSWWPSNQTDTSPITWVLPLEGLRIRSPSHRFRAQVVKSFITLLGVLVLPTLGGLLAYGFQQRQQVIVQERQENQKRIDRERQERQRQIDHERQAWANMLRVSHENNVEYYIPLGTAIRTLGMFCKEFRAAVEVQSSDRLERRRQAYFYFLYLFRRWRVMVDGGAGFYLKDRTGEELVAGFFGRWFDEVFIYLTPEERAEQSHLVDLMDADDSYSGFQAKLAKAADEERKAHEQLCLRVGDWLLSEAGTRAMQWLLLAHKILMFEVNRIYKFWYGSEPSFPTDEIDDLARSVEEDELNEEERALLSQLEAYSTNIS